MNNTFRFELKSHNTNLFLTIFFCCWWIDCNGVLHFFLPRTTILIMTFNSQLVPNFLLKHLISFDIGRLFKFTVNGCLHVFFVQCVWQFNSFLRITCPTRLILSMYSEIGYGPANNCRLHCSILDIFDGVWMALEFVSLMVFWRDTLKPLLEAILKQTKEKQHQVNLEFQSENSYSI